MRHADSLCAFCLARINGNDAPAYRLRHICSGIDGNHYNGSSPDRSEFDCVVGKIRKSVKQEYRLQHHRCSAEYFHIDTDHNSYQLQEKALDRMIVLSVGDRVENTADKADQAANRRSDQGQDQSILNTAEVGP